LSDLLSQAPKNVERRGFDLTDRTKQCQNCKNFCQIAQKYTYLFLNLSVDDVLEGPFFDSAQVLNEAVGRGEPRVVLASVVNSNSGKV
jgi:hypothetical protein